MSSVARDVDNLNEAGVGGAGGVDMFKRVLGLFVVLTACMLSGLAGVYFEKDTQVAHGVRIVDAAAETSAVPVVA